MTSLCHRSVAAGAESGNWSALARLDVTSRGQGLFTGFVYCFKPFFNYFINCLQDRGSLVTIPMSSTTAPWSSPGASTSFCWMIVFSRACA